MKDGPVDNVPTQVTIANNNTISISIDPSKVNNHFGDTPIYGLVHDFNGEMKMMKIAMNDSEMVKKWIPLMTGDMIKNMKDWRMNQSIMSYNDSMAKNMSMVDKSVMKGNTT